MIHMKSSIFWKKKKKKKKKNQFSQWAKCQEDFLTLKASFKIVPDDIKASHPPPQHTQNGKPYFLGK